MAAGHDPVVSVLRNKAGNQLRASSSPTLLRDISGWYTGVQMLEIRRVS